MQRESEFGTKRNYAIVTMTSEIRTQPQEPESKGTRRREFLKFLITGLTGSAVTRLVENFIPPQQSIPERLQITERQEVPTYTYARTGLLTLHNNSGLSMNVDPRQVERFLPHNSPLLQHIAEVDIVVERRPFPPLNEAPTSLIQPGWSWNCAIPTAIIGDSTKPQPPPGVRDVAELQITAIYVGEGARSEKLGPLYITQYGNFSPEEQQELESLLIPMSTAQVLEIGVLNTMLYFLGLEPNRAQKGITEYQGLLQLIDAITKKDQHIFSIQVTESPSNPQSPTQPPRIPTSPGRSKTG